MAGPDEGERMQYLGDKWLAASAMQKAIRRGDVEIAQQAAQSLLMLDRATFWRRLACTAIEDVAPTTPDLIVRALTATRHTDLAALIDGLCRAPKERSTDYLVASIQYHPDLSVLRANWEGELTEADYPYDVFLGSDIERRAALAWHLAGTVVVPGALPSRAGNPVLVFEEFRKAGIPALLVDACEAALRKLRNPLPLFYPLLWQAVSGAIRTWTENPPASTPPQLVHGIPLYALGHHTRLGKRAISLWVDKGRKLTLTLAKLAVPTKCWRQAAELGVFFVESAVIRPSLHWDVRERPTGEVDLDQDPSYDDPGQWDVGSYLRERGIIGDFAAIGFPITAIPPFLEVVSETLPHLDTIRAKIIEREVASLNAGTQARWDF